MNAGLVRLKLLRRARRPGRVGALLAGAALKVMPPARGDVDVPLWGRRFRLPADHHLPFIVRSNPFWSLSLAHCASALMRSPMTVLDIGANVGDSVVLLEQEMPGQCRFVCVEPNPAWIPYLERNTAGVNIEILPYFVGEGQRLEIQAGAPGTAGSRISDSGVVSRPLDEICEGRQIDLIKVDTDGFDYAILRSGERTLRSRKTALFFEWDPITWRKQGEKPEEIFEWLAGLGYRDFCFFADGGFFYCRINSKQMDTVRSLILAAEAREGVDSLYWDVFAAEPEACNAAIEKNVSAARKLAREVRYWSRLQPQYWQ